MSDIITLVSKEYATNELTGKGEFTTLEGRVGVAEGDINSATQRVATVEGDLDTVKTRVGTVESGKQDKLTAGENIKIENNVISATGGSSNENGLQPGDQVIYDIIPCDSTFTPITPLPSPYPLNLEINVNQKFPIKGFIELTHIIVPRLKVDRSGYYIGYSAKGTNYKQDHKLKDFWAVTSKPCNIENDGESTYIYNVECKKGQEFIGEFGRVDPNYGWSGWLDSSKVNYSAKIAYYSKSTDENGEDIYVYEADVPAYSTMPSEEPFPIYRGDSSQAWSNNPNFDPESQYIMNGMTVQIRPRMYSQYDVACGLKFIFHPDLDWPADHKVATPPTE